MCMKLEALLAFLALIGPELVESKSDRIIVRASQGDVEWIETGHVWCTEEPRSDHRTQQ